MFEKAVNKKTTLVVINHHFCVHCAPECVHAFDVMCTCVVWDEMWIYEKDKRIYDTKISHCFRAEGTNNSVRSHRTILSEYIFSLSWFLVIITMHIWLKCPYWSYIHILQSMYTKHYLSFNGCINIRFRKAYSLKLWHKIYSKYLYFAGSGSIYVKKWICVRWTFRVGLEFT